MSSSLANARRKFDASVRSIHLPTDIDPQDPEEPGFKTVEDRQVSRKAHQMLLFFADQCCASYTHSYGLHLVAYFFSLFCSLDSIGRAPSSPDIAMIISSNRVEQPIPERSGQTCLI